MVPSPPLVIIPAFHFRTQGGFRLLLELVACADVTPPLPERLWIRQFAQSSMKNYDDGATLMIVLKWHNGALLFALNSNDSMIKRICTLFFLLNKRSFIENQNIGTLPNRVGRKLS